MISHFMKKGEFYATPGDGIDVVQGLMVEQQIGQVPIVEQSGGAVIGIVTRTDLINLWRLTREEQPARVNLSKQLAESLSVRLLELLQEAGESATKRGDNLYIVGGFVRDLLLTMLNQNGSAATKTSLRITNQQHCA